MRKAADLVGATPMDRPEEIKVNPLSGNVFAVFTNNIKRDPLHKDAANPRALNRHGHILELIHLSRTTVLENISGKYFY